MYKLHDKLIWKIIVCKAYIENDVNKLRQIIAEYICRYLSNHIVFYLLFIVKLFSKKLIITTN